MKFTYLVVGVLLASLVSAQDISNTSWLTYNAGISDTVFVEISEDSVIQNAAVNGYLVSSSYTRDSNDIEITDWAGPFKCPSNLVGEYSYEIRDDTLEITLIDDLCFPRADVYDGQKLWRNYTSVNPIKRVVKTLKVFPNPSTGIINVDFSGRGVIQVFSSTGQLVIQKDVEEIQTNLSFNLPKGQFIVMHKSQGQISRTLVLVQ